MKQYIRYFVIALSFFVLSACGSNSKEDPVVSGSSSTTTTTSSGGLGTDTTSGTTTNQDTTVVDSAEYTFINASTPTVISNAATEYTLKVQVIQNQLPVSGQTIQLKAFKNPNDQYGTFAAMSASTDAQGYAYFIYTSPSNLIAVNNNIIKLEAILEYSGTTTDGNTSSAITKELTQEFILSFQVSDGSIPDTNGSSLTFLNASTPLEIVESETQYTMKVQLVDNGFPVSGKEIQLKAFSNPNDQYGSFASMSAVTDNQGYASFIYTSPQDIGPVNNTTLTLTSVLAEDNAMKQTFELSFNKTDAVVVSEKPFVVIPTSSKEVELNSNSQQSIININVYAGETNSPYSSGKVNVVLPAKIVDGVDVGKFESYSVDVVNGVATFTYTGPQDLQALVDSGDINSSFQFYHEEDATNKQVMSVIYNPTSDYVPVNYTLEVSSQDGSDFTMGIPDKQKTFSIVLKDDQGENVPKIQITSTQITVQNTFVGKLILDGTELGTGSTVQENPTTFNIKTNTVSGIVPIEVVINFTDANNISRTMSKTINVTVYSGPATAMSISYVGSEIEEAKAKYIDRFAVTATDAYGNQVNTTPALATGSIVGYAVDGTAPSATETSSTNRLYFAKNDISKATITPIGNDKATLTVPNDGSNRFQYVDPNNDKLVLFGEGYTYEALGKWDFSLSSNYLLELKDDYLGTQRDNLFYTIGHNYRQDPCLSDGTEYVGYAQIESEGSKLDSEGTAIVTFTYDYQLMGKDIMLWVNLNGYQADTGKVVRIGDAKKHTLQGLGLSASTDPVAVKAGQTKTYKFHIGHNGADLGYKNAFFKPYYDTTCTSVTTISTSNSSDARSCDNDGFAYIQYAITAGEEDCTFTFATPDIESEIDYEY